MKWDPTPFKVGIRNDNISEKGLTALKTLIEMSNSNEQLQEPQFKLKMEKTKSMNNAHLGGYQI